MRLLIQAVQTCIAERSVFSQEVMAATLQLLVAQEPLPTLQPYPYPLPLPLTLTLTLTLTPNP